MGNCCAISATPEFVQLARELCDKYGVLLIIDEVKTGFRVGQGRRPVAAWRQARHHHLRQGDGQRLSDRRDRRAARTSCAPSAMAARRMAAPTPRIRWRWPPPRRCLEILDETPALADIATYGETLKSRHQGDPRCARHRPFLLRAIPRCSACSSRRKPPSNYRDWKRSDYTFYDRMALSPARSRRDLRARFARAVVHVRGA